MVCRTLDIKLGDLGITDVCADPIEYDLVDVDVGVNMAVMVSNS